MLTPQILNNALIFLARADIKGGEAPAFLQTCQSLEAEMIRLNESAHTPETAQAGATPAQGPSPE